VTGFTRELLVRSIAPRGVGWQILVESAVYVSPDGGLRTVGPWAMSPRAAGSSAAGRGVTGPATTGAAGRG
jgi:hypothetical protein